MKNLVQLADIGGVLSSFETDKCQDDVLENIPLQRHSINFVDQMAQMQNTLHPFQSPRLSITSHCPEVKMTFKVLTVWSSVFFSSLVSLHPHTPTHPHTHTPTPTHTCFLPPHHCSHCSLCLECCSVSVLVPFLYAFSLTFNI